MVLDTSAIIAVLQREPESAHFMGLIKFAHVRVISAATSVETGIVVLSRQRDAGIAMLHEFMAELRVETVSLTADHVHLAVDAFRRFGKGRHPAGLNFGDCFSYALAKATDEPLLFKGDDFLQTDIKRAV